MGEFNEYELVVGLEVHIQLNTKTKLFSADTTLFGAEPNTQTNEVSLAHPGTLPVLNDAAVGKAIRLGLACNCDITQEFYFDRKHYFYPDSPLGYQITQQNTPICQGGYLSIPTNDGEKEISIEKIHMEADAGKSIHDLHDSLSLIDLNRAGMPLLELVTKPVLYSIDHVAAFITEIQKVVRFLGISDGNMEAGSLRCDANISVKRKSQGQLGQKVEIKNMNSVRHIKKALEFEFIRQANMLKVGETVLSESRLFDVAKGMTMEMRDKEEAHDYRYFPDPDLAPVSVTDTKLVEIKGGMPTLPSEFRSIFLHSHKLSATDALILSDDQVIAELQVSCSEAGASPEAVAKWLLGPVKGLFNTMDEANFVLEAAELTKLIDFVDTKKITYRNAVDLVLPELVKKKQLSTEGLIEKLGLSVQSDSSELDTIVAKVLSDHPKEVDAYKNGKKAILQLFMGKVMKATGGKADPRTTIAVLKDQLD